MNSGACWPGEGDIAGIVRRARYEMRQVDPNSNIQLSLKIDKEPVLYEYRKITTEKENFSKNENPSSSCS